MPQLTGELQKCILNKVSYDSGEFELNVMYSAIAHIPLLDADENRVENFNEIFFTVFENKGTNNDMGDLMADEFTAFLAEEELDD
jgi:hypothetical protein